jgi:ABC-type multidrug transport system ATPase subunit
VRTGIVAEGISKNFGGLTVLDRLDLTVDEGEIVALVGENGAGKTTLLRVLATTLVPDAGNAWVAGFNIVRDARAVRGSIGLMLGDERSWYWRLSGRQNLAFFGALYGLASEVSATRADTLLAEQGLTGAANRRVSDYSKGMRLRLGLARALLPDPRVLLLDEPTGSLDPAATEGFRLRLAEIVAQRAVAVLLVTHDLEDTRNLADRTVVLSSGRAIALADAAEVERLADTFLNAVPK